ncbi:hypothetical protein SD70_15715 [Gordoniibacillus kamchatkensis]|uniref:O-antigen ligase-related domain-containing protein n=1 Tax=Gordoniibacillus kamchatkensis TaxID=1590651 RepID=A0ABR5AID6_9BACL|nr:O-antigen ligase family protein [Paenibacillus sp. VKM B-2647]KIL40122.1 hypothetical protein SD70_15715 [Paenibacillus sp. VKM B-2647]
MPKYARLTGAFLLGLTVACSFIFHGLFFQKEQHIAEAMVAFAFLLWWFGFRLERRRIALFSSWLELSVLAILLLYLLTSFTALFPQGHANVVLQWAGGLLVLYAMREECKIEPRWGLWLSWVLIAASLGVVSIGLAIYMGGHVGLNDANNLMSEKNRFASTFQYANTYAIYVLAMWLVTIGAAFSGKSKWLMLPVAGIVCFLYSLTFLLAASRGALLAVPAAMIGLVVALPRGQRLAGAAFFIGTMTAGLLTVKGADGHASSADWNGAWSWLMGGGAAGAVIGLATAALMIQQKSRRLNVAAVIAAGLVAMGVLHSSSLSQAAIKLSSQKLQRLTNMSLNETNAFLRLEFDRDALKMIRDHPVVGSGGDGWSRMYHQYQRFYYIANLTHNHYLQIAVELGLVGLALFVLFWWSLATCLRKADPPSLARVLGVAAIVIGLHSFIDFDLNFYSMLLLVLMIAGIVSAQMPPLRWSTTRFQALGAGVAGCLILATIPQAVGDYYLQAGSSELEQGQSDEAAAHLARAAALLPLDPQPHVQLARAKIGTNEQLSQLLLAQRLDPYNAEWPHELSLALGYYKKWEDAYRESEKALRLQPAMLDYYESTLDYGVQAAIDSFLKGKASKDGEIASNALIVEQMVRYQQSANRFKNYVLATYRDSSPLLDLRAGQALALAGNYSEAIPFLRQSRKTATLVPEADIWLFMTYRQQQDKRGQNEIASRPWIAMLDYNPINGILNRSR